MPPKRAASKKPVGRPRKVTQQRATQQVNVSVRTEAPRRRRRAPSVTPAMMTQGRVVPSNYNQTGALGAPIQIRPAFPGVMKPFRVQEYPRDYSNLSASVNPGIPGLATPGIPSPGVNFLTQPGPSQQVPPSYAGQPPSAQMDALLKQLQGMIGDKFTAQQVEPYGVAQVTVPDKKTEDTTAFASVPDRAAAPAAPVLSVLPTSTRQQLAAQVPQARPASVSVNPTALAQVQQEALRRDNLVRTSAFVQEWNNSTQIPSARSTVSTIMRRTPGRMAQLEDESNIYMRDAILETEPDSSRLYPEDFVSFPSTESNVGANTIMRPSRAQRLAWARERFNRGEIDYYDASEMGTEMEGAGLTGSAGGNSGWYRGTTPTMKAAGDKRLAAQYAQHAYAQRNMEQRVDYFGLAGTGLVRSTPVYERGDVGFAEPPKGAATINTASYGGRARVAIADPNSHKVGQAATTGQTLQQQRVAAMYEQGVVERPRLNASGQPYFDQDVSRVGAYNKAAAFMPNAIFSKLAGSPPAI